MFDLAVGLEQSEALLAAKLYFTAVNVPQTLTDEVKKYLQSIGITYFDTFYGFYISAEVALTIICGTALGQISINCTLQGSSWIATYTNVNTNTHVEISRVPIIIA